MYNINFLIRFSWILVVFNACGQDKEIGLPPEPTTPSTDEWQLIWGDEFDYTGLPDATKWGYEIGHSRNNEKQYYTNRLENVTVGNGLLTITGRKEQYPNAAYVPGSTDWKKKDEYASYTSACLITKGKFKWTYGKIEVRAKLPKGKGVWPAIWTLGADQPWWPDGGEIDIMEHVGFEPNIIHTNIHYLKASDGKYATQMTGKTISGIYDNFKIYSMEWNESKIAIFVDGLLLNTFDVALAGETYKKPQYLLLNLALGGDWGGPIDDNIFPQKYEIDYVRVYQKKKK